MSRASPALDAGSPSSPRVAPLTAPSDGKQAISFPPLTSPRLNSIQELGENIESVDDGSRPRQLSISSITFLPPPDTKSLQPRGPPGYRKGRTSSPEPPSRFQPHVSFDNFGGGEPTEKNTISFTLNVKHKGYTYRKRSRTFMVGIDENTYSDFALRWLLDELVDDGDEIVCLRVVDKDAKISSDKSLGRKEYQEEARLLMQKIQEKNDENRAISIILEFAVGKVHTTFQKMIQLYEPAMLIVGTKGRSLGGFQGLVSNRSSFSKWCLQYSPIPVVVVRPTEMRDKKKQKRAADPSRQGYVQLLQESGHATHEATISSSDSIKDVEILPQNSPNVEAHEVASALGLPARFDPTLKPINVERALRGRQESGQSDASIRSLGSASPESRPTSPMDVRKSPKVAPLDSPMVSDDSDSEGEFEVSSGHALVGNQMKLHEMEVGEAAALAAGRKGSIGSIDSSISASGGGEEAQKGDGG